MPSVTLNERTYDLATLIANAGYGYVGKDDRGYTLWPDAIFFDMLVELGAIKAPGGVSISPVSIGTGAKSWTLAAAATMPAGTWVAYSAGSPSNFMIVTLETTLTAGTALSVTSQIAIGSGTFTDWAFAPLNNTRRAVNIQTGDYTMLISDFRALIVMNKASAVTLTIPAVSTLGTMFESEVLNIGAGAVSFTPNASDAINGGTAGAAITLYQGEAISWAVKGANDIRVTSARGNGSISQGLHIHWIDSNAFQKKQSGGPDIDSTSETSTNYQRKDGLLFDGASIERARARFVLPPKYKNGSAIRAYFMVLAPASSNAHRWGLRAVAASHDDPLDAAFGTAQEVTVTNTATGDVLLSAATADITIAGSPVANDLVNVEVYRDPTAGADTDTNDVLLIAVGIAWQSDKPVDLFS